MAPELDIVSGNAFQASEWRKERKELCLRNPILARLRAEEGKAPGPLFLEINDDLYKSLGHGISLFSTAQGEGEKPGIVGLVKEARLGRAQHPYCGFRSNCHVV